MRISIYVKEETDQEIIKHIEKLKANGDNVSRFFINVAKKAIEGDKKDLRQTVKEIIEQEYKMPNESAIEPLNDISDISNKLKQIYD